jgi:membrane protein DedA with SNARE-associated domain
MGFERSFQSIVYRRMSAKIVPRPSQSTHVTNMSFNPINSVNEILAVALSHDFLFPLAIIVGTLILEDLTTILVGIFAATGAVKIPVAVVALCIGICLGDYGLYGMGMLARTHPTIRRFLQHKHLLAIRGNLERNLRQMVITTRFIPGLRLPTYIACGFFSMPFGEFACLVILATLVWTPSLFFAAYLLGYSTEEWLGVWRWPISAGIAMAVLSVGHYHSRKISLHG